MLENLKPFQVKAMSSSETRQPDQQTKDKPKQVDPFWLRKVFPDATEVFSFSAPPVSTLFADALFAIDANALLAPYQISRQSADELERIYRELAGHERLFVPEQAAREFAKNRGLKLSEMYDEVNRLTSSLPKVDSINCPMLQDESGSKELAKEVEAIRGSVKKYKDLVSSLKQTLCEWAWNDRVSSLYRELFVKTRIIGHEVTDEDFLKQLTWRYAHQVPPGYKDKAKPDSGVGDLAIWFSLLKLGRDRKKDVIFVCNETKHDWVYRSGDQTLIPRIELCLEFSRETGRHFGLVNWARFLELAGAKDDTVRDAVRAGRWASTKYYELMPVVERVKQTLSDINVIVEEGLIDNGTGYSYLRRPDLDSLVDAFRKSMPLYSALVRPSVGFDRLEEIERILQDVVSLNNLLEYLEARMKQNGDEESERLEQKCKEFKLAYHSFLAGIAV